MNPKDFIAPWDAFELASFVKDNNVDILVVPYVYLTVLANGKGWHG